jgi:hypothetical protein
MLATIALQGVREKSTDPDLLQAYLQQLVGQPFLQFRFSYGDELSLHFGQPRAYDSPRMKHLLKGSYILGTRASHWYLRSASPTRLVLGCGAEQGPPGPDLQPLTKQDLETADLVKPGARIVLAAAFPITFPGTAAIGFGLSLLLSDGSSFLITPEALAASQPEEEALADWELFTPYERYLRVGPGVEWSYLPSRHPAPPQTA